ncbi:MAG: 2-phospho-L-lactate transferase [Alphaproteobacteria bacterium]|nr:2-phospho-L-lactate transferase [Alphaproteobacteria bacterium]MDP6517716.1 2-phospho-L-lactate transferase [Alphaproteobacteria bacterium]
MILALAGGVGGAKLADGLARHLPVGSLTVVVNTGDDFTPLGLHVSPDLDTVTYTLAGIANAEVGWGLAGETWNFMDALGLLGGTTWFRLGDRDLATHVERTRRLSTGESLSAITADFRARLGIAHPIHPMSDAPVRTMVDTDAGPLPFQDYFVRLRCRPIARRVWFAGIEDAGPSPGFEQALGAADLDAIVICPSNPILSVLPILDLAGVRSRLEDRRVPLIAISPIVGGKAIKGPAAKIMAELGLDASATGIAHFYGDLLDGLVVDRADTGAATAIEALGPRVLVTDTVMTSPDDRVRLARESVAFARSLAPPSLGPKSPTP